MEDYASFLARSRLPHGIFGRLVQLLQHWRSRRSFARLRHASEYQLKDIGLSRADVERLANLPLAVDPVWEAERLRFSKSRSPAK